MRVGVRVRVRVRGEGEGEGEGALGHLGDDLPYISPVSPLCLPYISPASPLHLGHLGDDLRLLGVLLLEPARQREVVLLELLEQPQLLHEIYSGDLAEI